MTQNKEVSIEDMNVILARFEGRKFYGKYTIDDYGPTTHNAYPEMKYHSDWNWLMDCWARFRVVVSDHFDEDYPAEYCSMCDIWALECEHVNIHGAHKLLYKAITWYNTTLK